MAIFSPTRTSTAKRAGSKQGTLVVEGVDAIVRQFTREAATVGDRAEKVVTTYAEKAAGYQRDRVRVDQGDLLDSITADDKAQKQGRGTIYADAGPDRRANDEAWRAHFEEYGTSKMPPHPFVGPSADRVIPEFEQAMKRLSNL